MAAPVNALNTELVRAIFLSMELPYSKRQLNYDSFHSFTGSFIRDQSSLFNFFFFLIQLAEKWNWKFSYSPWLIHPLIKSRVLFFAGDQIILRCQNFVRSITRGRFVRQVVAKG